MVSATPLTRSSYHADADFAALKAARAAMLAASERTASEQRAVTA
jgi:lipoic acid synthetase